MGRSFKLVLIGLVVLAVLGIGAVALYVFVLQDDPPERVALSDDTVPPEDGDGTENPDGEWTVQAGEDSFLGYRVTEELASLPNPSDAVGRTPAVRGTLTVGGTQVSAGEVSADLRELASDMDRRDNFIRENGLQTDEFPDATFTLTEPIDMGTVPEQGATVEVTAVGDLTLHGVTNQVEVPLEARWSGDTIEVVGTLPITFADYEIDPPNIGGFVTVEDEGEMELQLTFVPA